jgi:TRAP-type C4-dicarboxylate transport system permease large subunit
MMLGVFFLGCIMDAPSILFLTMPIYLPIATSLGYDLIWFGILVLLNLEIATITPPVGLNLYILKGIAPEISARDIIHGVAPYWGIDAIALLIVALFPPLVTWLPNALIGVS